MLARPLRCSCKFRKTKLQITVANFLQFSPPNIPAPLRISCVARVSLHKFAPSSLVCGKLKIRPKKSIGGVTNNKGFTEARRWNQVTHRPEAGGTCYTARLAQLRSKVSAI